jgi:hypothetical protein
MSRSWIIPETPLPYFSGMQLALLWHRADHSESQEENWREGCNFHSQKLTPPPGGMPILAATSILPDSHKSAQQFTPYPRECSS